MHIEHILAMAALGLHANGLRVLSLIMKGDGTQLCTLDSIVSGIIAPARQQELRTSGSHVSSTLDPRSRLWPLSSFPASAT
jgi:hypothetical protein